MDIRKVKKLIELLDESGIAEIEITEGDESLRISRYSHGTAVAPLAPMAPAAPAAPAVAAPPPAAPPSSREPELATERPAPAPSALDAEEDGHVVIAPMVGTFYAAATPGAAPYVQVGDRVSEGDTLCIIEAMKMMNQIEADTSGVIKSIRAQNGEPVEFGQPLFVIDQRTG